MKKGKTFLSAALCAAALLAAAEAQFPDLDFSGASYQCRIFSRRNGDSGFINLKFDGKHLMRGNRVYGVCRGAEKGEDITLSEQPMAEFKWENNVLSNERFLIPRKARGDDAGKYAKISRRITFGQDKITVEITVTALRDITFPSIRRNIREVIGIVTDSVRGMRIEGVRFDGQVISSLIPVRYERRKWSFTTYYRQLSMTSSEKLNMQVSAATGSKLYLNHYGGASIELEIFPEIRAADLRQKAGTETRIGYTIEFKKTE